MMKPFFVFILALSSLPVFSQNNIFKTSLDKWRTENPQEKIFVQTDKEVYFAGETIWMKAWCILDGVPTDLSKQIYITLSNTAGIIVHKKLYKLDSVASCAGDFVLPDTISTGNYTLHAYSLWMLNYSNFVFKKSLFIYNTGAAPVFKTASTPVSVNFFPEGGDLVEGLTSRVGVKVTDKFGYPLTASGTVKDKNTKAPVTNFSTKHDGLCYFEITPAAGKEYNATVSVSGIGELEFNLPRVKKEGIVLKVENSNPGRLFALINCADNNRQKYNKAQVIAQMHNTIVYQAMLDIDAGQNAISIPKKNLPPGIMQVTVFAENIPVAERLCFIDNFSVLSPDIKTELISRGPQARNVLSFEIPEAEKLKSISCQVISYDKKDTLLPTRDNIVSHLLLSNDINGYIHNPGYYFNDKSPVKLKHLDLLMLTQGWRRFKWDEVLTQSTTPLLFPFESSIVYKGTMHKSDRKETISNGRVSFIVRGADSTTVLAEAATNDKGEFIVKGLNFTKEASIAYMGTDLKKENFIVDVKLEPNYIDTLKANGLILSADMNPDRIMQQNTLLQNYYRLQQEFNKNKVVTLDEVTIRTRVLTPEEKLNKEYASPMFQLGKSIDPSSYKHFTTIWQILRQAVSGITVGTDPFDPEVSFNRFAGMGSGGGGGNLAGAGAPGESDISTAGLETSNGIAYFINEINVPKEVFATLSVDDVALIKVMKTEAFALGANMGAIVAYTKTGSFSNKRVYDKSYTVVNKEGYAIEREFYSPTPDVLPASNDLRYTLYWNGNIQAAKDGKFRIQFYNNQSENDYMLIIQGLDKDGNFIYYKRELK